VAVPSKLPTNAGKCESMSSGLSESSAVSGSNVADVTSDSKNPPTVPSSSLPQPSSVRRKTSLSRLPTPGTYMAGKTSLQTKLPSDGHGDGLVKAMLPQATVKLASAIACPAAVDKRKTVTAIRSLGMRNSTTKSVPLKAVTPTVPGHAGGMFEILLHMLHYLYHFLCHLELKISIML